MSYIDKDALGIGYAKREMFIDPAYADGWNAAIEIVENTPDADVEPIRHGEWIKKEERVWYWYECSECGEKPLKSEYGDRAFSRYCPSCGALMDKGEVDI